MMLLSSSITANLKEQIVKHEFNKHGTTSVIYTYGPYSVEKNKDNKFFCHKGYIVKKEIFFGGRLHYWNILTKFDGPALYKYLKQTYEEQQKEHHFWCWLFDAEHTS